MPDENNLARPNKMISIKPRLKESYIHSVSPGLAWPGRALLAYYCLPKVKNLLEGLIEFESCVQDYHSAFGTFCIPDEKN